MRRIVCIRLFLLMVQFQTGLGTFHMKRVSAREFRENPTLKEPVVIEDVYDLNQCNGWMNHILTRSANEQVKVEFQGEQGSQIERVPLKQAARRVMVDEAPILVTSEGSSCSTDQLPLYDLIDSLFSSSVGSFDWFSFFACHAQVPDTLLLAGTGASCALSSCPYTRCSMILDGKQLHRALPPDKNTKIAKSIIKPTSIESFDGFTFRSGSQSNARLFDDSSLIGRQQQNQSTDTGNSDVINDDDKHNFFRSIYSGESINSEESEPHNLHSTVALTGDILIIPPFWWHQSYQLEPSVSVLSQRCGSDFIGYILKEEGLNDSIDAVAGLCNIITDKTPRSNSNGSMRTDYSEMEAMQVVNELFELLEEKHSYS